MPALPQTVVQQTISYQNIRVGAGNPNAIGQYGEPGWIYQDWTGGALYVCTVAGTAGWTLSSSGGQPSNPLLDGAGFPSVDFYNRSLTTSIDPNEGSNASINWESRQLFNSEANPTLNWNSSILTDSNGFYVASINWTNRYLYDFDEAITVDWNGKALVTLDDGSSSNSLGWGARILYNDTGSATVSWNAGQLSFGEIVSVNWATRTLSELDGFTTVDWGLGIMYDSLHDITFNWYDRYLLKQWTTLASGKTSGNVMSNAQYLPTTNTAGTYNPVAPANAGMVIFHQAASAALIASMTLQLHGATSALDSVPVGGDISFTSRYGVTALTVTYGTHVLLGTPVTTCAAGATITWRKLAVIGGSTYIARLT